MGPNIIGGPGGGPPPGPEQQGPTQIGGATAPQGARGGDAGGGPLAAAGGIGAAAADMFAPGSGAAVQIAMQEIQRAIKFGGQAAGIGVQGLMETFLPTGASQLANNNWITQIAGGFASAAPALPNVAGKPSTPVNPQQAAPPLPPPGVHTGTGAPPGPAGPAVNIEHYHVETSEDRAGQDIARHAMAANQIPSMGR